MSRDLSILVPGRGGGPLAVDLRDGNGPWRYQSYSELRQTVAKRQAIHYRPRRKCTAAGQPINRQKQKVVVTTAPKPNRR